MGLIEQIRAEGFRYWQLSEADSLDERFNEIEILDWTICYNDEKYNIWSHEFVGGKMETLTRGKLYQVLDKKVNDKDDKVVKIINDKGKNTWILTDRFAFNPELAQNNLREQNLKKILDDDEEITLT